VLAYYESQTDDEVAAEYEVALADPKYTTMEVPVELVPAIRQLIAEYEAGVEVAVDSR
jgi:hypothetical protein